MLAALTGEQLSGWADYYSREPFGFPVEDIRHAQTLSMAANVGGSDPPTTPETFSYAKAIAEGELDEEGNPSDEVLVQKLAVMLAAKKR